MQNSFVFWISESCDSLDRFYMENIFQKEFPEAFFASIDIVDDGKPVKTHCS